MAEKREPVGFLEAVVRIPIYAGDKMSERGPGDWWEYASPEVTPLGQLTTCNRTVKEISRRMLDATGIEVGGASELPEVDARPNPPVSA